MQSSSFYFIRLTEPLSKQNLEKKTKKQGFKYFFYGVIFFRIILSSENSYQNEQSCSYTVSGN